MLDHWDYPNQMILRYKKSKRISRFRIRFAFLYKALYRKWLGLQLMARQYVLVQQVTFLFSIEKQIITKTFSIGTGLYVSRISLSHRLYYTGFSNNYYSNSVSASRKKICSWIKLFDFRKNRNNFWNLEKFAFYRQSQFLSKVTYEKNKPKVIQNKFYKMYI